MDNQTPLYIGIVVCVVVLSIWITYESTLQYECHTFLNGFWEAPLVFCKSAGIKNAYAYIKDDSVYFFVEDEDKILVNKCVEHTLEPCIWSNIGEVSHEYDFEAGEDISPLPQSMTLRAYPSGGFIAFYKDDTIQLQLYKNHKATAGIV